MVGSSVPEIPGEYPAKASLETTKQVGFDRLTWPWQHANPKEKPTKTLENPEKNLQKLRNP